MEPRKSVSYALLPFTRVSEAKIIINLPLLRKLLAQREKNDFILMLLRFINNGTTLFN